MINVLVPGWLYQLDFTDPDGLSGCAFAFDDLFDPTHGPCIPVTGRRR
jgi:hypothetical protein